MILGVSTGGLSNLYRQQTMDYTRQLEQIASGRRFARPSDDFTGFMRMRNAETSAASFQRVNDDLITAKESSTAASSFGNAVYEGLNELKGLAELRRVADADGRARIDAEFNQKIAGLRSLISANNAADRKAISNQTVNINPGGTGSLNFTPANISLSNIVSAGVADNVFNTALTNVITYTATADAFSSSVDRQLTINQNIVAAKENTASAIGAIDEISAIGKATALAVRQQATIAMASQANIVQSNIARLFS